MQDEQVNSCVRKPLKASKFSLAFLGPFLWGFSSSSKDEGLTALVASGAGPAGGCSLWASFSPPEPVSSETPGDSDSSGLLPGFGELRAEKRALPAAVPQVAVQILLAPMLEVCLLIHFCSVASPAIG